MQSLKPSLLRSLLLPACTALAFFAAYRLIGFIGLWIFLTFSYGFWFSAIAVKAAGLSLSGGQLSAVFVGLGALLYIFTLFYSSLDSSSFLLVRRNTFLPLNGVGYLILFRILFKIDCRFIDFVMVLFYGTGLNISLTDESYKN